MLIQNKKFNSENFNLIFQSETKKVLENGERYIFLKRIPITHLSDNLESENQIAQFVNFKAGEPIEKDRIIGKKISDDDLVYLENQMNHAAKIIAHRNANMINHHLCRMMLGSEYRTESQIGIRSEGWQIPDDLKISSFSEQLISNIELLKTLGKHSYDEIYNRITLSSRSSNNIFESKSFTNRIGVSPKEFSRGELRQKLADMLQMEVEIYDGIINSYKDAETPVLPLNKILLSSSLNDDNPKIMEFISEPPTESIVMSLINPYPSGEKEPIGYITADVDDKSDIKFWGLWRGCARKYKKSATAVITIED